MSAYEQAMSAVHEATERQREQNETHRRLMAKQEELELKIARTQLVMPGNPWERKAYEHTVQLPEEDKAFLKFFSKGERSLQPSERKALVEDAGGGQYLVSPYLDNELQRVVGKLVVLRQLAAKRTIDKDRIEVRDITEAAVGWGALELGTLITETTPVPSAPAYKYAEDLNGLVKIGQDLLEDSDFNLQNVFVDSFSRKLAEAQETGFALGGGHVAHQPDGILLDATLVANAVKTTATGAVTVEKFMELVYSVPAIYRKNGSFVVHSATELALRQIRAGGSTTTDGPFLWQPSTIAGTPPTFLGYPIYFCDELYTLADVASPLAIFGDFLAGYQVIDRVGTTVQRLDELYSEEGCIGFKVRMRVGGYVKKPSNKALALLIEAS
jgi:HK97 family phage major capsid protein